MMKKLILFDLDGTLLDTSQGIFSCLRYAVKKMNLTIPEGLDLSIVIGPPIKVSFMNIFNLSSEEADKAVEYFREEYQDSGIKLSKPYDGIENLLIKLKEAGYTLGVATLKPQLLSEKILAYHNIDKYFDFISGADMDAKYTKSIIINIALENLKFSKEDTLMVGDTISDGKGSFESQVDFLPVMYGFGLKSENDLNAYPHIQTANNTEEVYKIVMNL